MHCVASVQIALLHASQVYWDIMLGLSVEPGCRAERKTAKLSTPPVWSSGGKSDQVGHTRQLGLPV